MGSLFNAEDNNSIGERIVNLAKCAPAIRISSSQALCCFQIILTGNHKGRHLKLLNK